MTTYSLHNPTPSKCDSSNRDEDIPTTLVVEKDTHLTIHQAFLSVSYETSSKNRSCCNFWRSDITNTCTLPLYNILWAHIFDLNLIIHYTKPISKKHIQSHELKFFVEYDQIELVKKWISTLLDRSYVSSQRQKRIKVIVNPMSGKGCAVDTYFQHVVPLLRAANCYFDMIQTTHKGQAIEILKELDIEAYDVVACCSGDGLPHEAFNGLGVRSDAKRALSKIAIVQIPCGSGNAMSCNLNGSNSPSIATLAIIKGIPMSLDLICITQGETRSFSFLSQSIGIVAESDLATEHLRFLGTHRFTFGLLTRILKKNVYPCDIAVKVAMEDKQIIKDYYKTETKYNEYTKNNSLGQVIFDMNVEKSLPPIKFGSINDELPEDWELVPYDKLGNFYCGNMAYMTANANFFPASMPNDGFMDLVCINGDVSRLLALKILMEVEKGTFFDLPEVWYRKILGYRIIPRNQDNGYISIDGERVPFKPFQAEIHKGLGTVLSKNGYSYEASGPK